MNNNINIILIIRIWEIIFISIGALKINRFQMCVELQELHSNRAIRVLN